MWNNNLKTYCLYEVLSKRHIICMINCLKDINIHVCHSYIQRMGKLYDVTLYLESQRHAEEGSPPI